ncbi:type II toxin-antitoxin system RatA family toxin [Aquicella lusitana]|uniref:Ribosome-associated toxin RatA of RatAB toxin-antitoxin module n=1 Tax=Aquicella lusitana TaxID=254246 RepID=A0A370GWX6_9COXI|nr:type II toxin-antitoxin system RatA family toxin [Aquicella lusitana]RDI48051.1 ribosome-associated toxin RatA of RatAB toxin-antitoxin module [Aquicella lusitana]VVC72932.1 Persistence and stress-resistance toxin PasT [Aquicella lusitana]
MNILKRSALVPYTSRQMFELVNGIEDYPRFLPWCHSSKIISRTEEEVVAELEINWKGIHKSFTTRNRLYPYERMTIELINGPLKHMEGIWQFQPLDTHACKVLLDLEFEFAGGFIDRLFQPVFQHIANTLVDAFCKRATELYGHE